MCLTFIWVVLQAQGSSALRITATGMARRILDLLRGLLMMSVGIATVDGTAGTLLMAGLYASTFNRGDWQPLFHSIRQSNYKVPDGFYFILFLFKHGPF